MKFGLPAFPNEALARLRSWTPEQAALFTIGLAPEHLADGSQILGGDVDLFTSNVRFRITLFEAHSRDPMTPLDWLAWCRTHGHKFDEVLARLIDGQPRQITDLWTVKPMQRGSDDLRSALHKWLGDQDKTQPRPTAAQVLAAFAAVKPKEVFEVLSDELKFYDHDGNPQSVGLKQLGQRLRAMTEVIKTA
jgi:hypothetical protein